MNFEKKRESFEERKRKFFSKEILSVKSAFQLHKNPGKLWDIVDGKRDWGNVSEHCLVEVVRTEEIARMVGLPDEKIRELKLGAALHDFDKRIEIEMMKEALKNNESSSEASDNADKIGNNYLKNAGFSKNVIEVAGSVGGKPPELFDMMEILEKEELTNQDIARLIIHYVDGYTRGSEWVEPMDAEMNEIDCRMQKSLDNPTYQKQNKEFTSKFDSHPLLRGRGPIENEALVCHMIEKKLAELINQKTGETINPLELPEIIDRKIKMDIEGTEQ